MFGKSCLVEKVIVKNAHLEKKKVSPWCLTPSATLLSTWSSANERGNVFATPVWEKASVCSEGGSLLRDGKPNTYCFVAQLMLTIRNGVSANCLLRMPLLFFFSFSISASLTCIYVDFFLCVYYDKCTYDPFPLFSFFLSSHLWWNLQNEVNLALEIK